MAAPAGPAFPISPGATAARAGAGLSAKVAIRQIHTGDEVRRLAVIRRPLGNSLLVAAAVIAVLAVVAGTGRGGGQDGALGLAMALAILVGGAVYIQRFGRVPVLVGFNPDGLWTPRAGWIGWEQVRHLEVRRSGGTLRGRRHTLWVRYLPSGPDTAEAWLGIAPRLRQAHTLALIDEMARCWTQANEAAKPAVAHAAAGAAGGPEAS